MSTAFNSRRIKREVELRLSRSDIQRIYVGASPSITFNIEALALVQVSKGHTSDIEVGVFESQLTTYYEYSLSDFNADHCGVM